MRNIIRILLATFLLATLSNCTEIEIKDNRRIVVTGQVVDFNGEPRPAVEVGVRGNGVLLGIGNSDDTGRFEVFSLEGDSESLNFRVGSNQFDSGTTFASFSVNQNSALRTANTYDLGVVSIRQKASLNINIQRENNSTAEQLNYTFRLKDTGCIITIAQGNQIDATECYQEIEITNLLNTENPNASRSLESLLGSVVEFEYTIDDDPTETISINLTEDTNDFDFTY